MLNNQVISFFYACGLLIAFSCLHAHGKAWEGHSVLPRALSAALGTRPGAPCLSSLQRKQWSGSRPGPDSIPRVLFSQMPLRLCKATGRHKICFLFSIPGKITKFFYFYKAFFLQWTQNVLLIILSIALWRKILCKNYHSVLTDGENWDREIECLARGHVASQFSSQK